MVEILIIKTGAGIKVKSFVSVISLRLIECRCEPQHLPALLLPPPGVLVTSSCRSDPSPPPPPPAVCAWGLLPCPLTASSRCYKHRLEPWAASEWFWGCYSTRDFTSNLTQRWRWRTPRWTTTSPDTVSCGAPVVCRWWSEAWEEARDTVGFKHSFCQVGISFIYSEQFFFLMKMHMWLVTLLNVHFIHVLLFFSMV